MAERLFQSHEGELWPGTSADRALCWAWDVRWVCFLEARRGRAELQCASLSIAVHCLPGKVSSERLVTCATSASTVAGEDQRMFSCFSSSPDPKLVLIKYHIKSHYSFSSSRSMCLTRCTATLSLISMISTADCWRAWPLCSNSHPSTAKLIPLMWAVKVV